MQNLFWLDIAWCPHLAPCREFSLLFLHCMCLEHWKILLYCFCSECSSHFKSSASAAFAFHVVLPCGTILMLFLDCMWLTPCTTLHFLFLQCMWLVHCRIFVLLILHLYGSHLAQSCICCFYVSCDLHVAESFFIIFILRMVLHHKILLLLFQDCTLHAPCRILLLLILYCVWITLQNTFPAVFYDSIHTASTPNKSYQNAY